MGEKMLLVPASEIEKLNGLCVDIASVREDFPKHSITYSLLLDVSSRLWPIANRNYERFRE